MATPESHDDGGIGQAVSEISHRASLLIREEIELAKAEVTEKVTKLAKGAAIGAAAGIFAVFGLIYLLHGLSWMFADLFLPAIFWGFFLVAALLFIAGGVAGFIAAKLLKAGSPPTPVMAIDEAQRIRATLTGERGGQVEAVAARARAGQSADDVEAARRREAEAEAARKASS